MEGKLPEDQIKSVLAPWRFSWQASGFRDRLLTALELYERFPLDIVVTGGTKSAITRLVSVICGLKDEQEDEDDDDDDDDDDDEETDEYEDDDEQEDEENDFSPVLLHPQIPNVRILMVHGPSSPPHDSYDVLLVLTTELHQDDHIRLIMDQGEKNKPLYLVKMDKEMEIIRGRLDGPCKTCAWERMQARALEFQKKRKLELESTDNAKHQQTSKVPSGIKLWEPEEIAEVLLKDIPELRKKAFSKFLVDFTSEQRKLKSTSTGFFAGSAFLKNNKMSQEDVDKTSLVFQSQDLTDQPSKLLSIFNALEYFRLDVGLLGETGCGSSSLFNSLLSLKNGDSRASPVGVFETTKTPVTYLYSECHNVLLWDLPGLRRVEDFKTVSSDVASHQDLQIPPCDVYILVSPLRLNLGCIHLLKQLLAQGKDCYLVLSKADLIEEKSIDDVRRWTEEILDKLGLKQIMYLVSALHPETLDLPKMIKTLKDAQDSHKRAALANYVVKLLEEDMFWKRADPCKIN